LQRFKLISQRVSSTLVRFDLRINSSRKHLMSLNQLKRRFSKLLQKGRI